MKLPFPAHNLSPEPIAPEQLPQPCKREGPFAPNNALRSAQRLFEGRVIGSGAPHAIAVRCMVLHTELRLSKAYR